MGFWNVIAAGGAAWLAGLVYYARLGDVRASLAGVQNPASGLPLWIGGLAVLILVAGFLRHIFFVSGLTSNVPLGAVAGSGVGLFFIAPWIGLMNFADRRPFSLTLLDGAYATLASGIMGGLLVAF